MSPDIQSLLGSVGGVISYVVLWFQAQPRSTEMLATAKAARAWLTSLLRYANAAA